MSYECLACANLFDGTKRSRCPECGSRRTIDPSEPDRERGCCATEQWRDVVGYIGVYQVSSCGRLRAFITGGGTRLTRPRPHGLTSLDKDGYVKACLRGRSYRAHRLVAEAFHGPCPPGGQAAHLDGCPTNNHASNLAWVTSAENHRHKTRHGTLPRGTRVHTHKLTEATVALVIDRLAAGVRQYHIATELGVSRSIINRIKVGQTWKHIPREANDVPAG